jgi:hypothetical protein
VVSEQTLQRAAAGRAVIGASSFLTPELGGRLMGLERSTIPHTAYMARLFGVRDAALGYGLSQSRGDARTTWLRAAAACDLGDAVATYIAWRRGHLPTPSAVLIGITAVGALGLGLAALSGE